MHPIPLRRRALLAGLPAVAALCSAPARAQGGGWRPSRPITMIVPFAAGSGTDTVARRIAPPLAQELGAAVVVENRPGANGAIAATATARARPDGLTILMTTNTTHAANPALMRRLDYDPVRDFTPVARLGAISFVLAVGRHVPARTVAEVIAWARTQPRGFTYGSANAIGVVGMATFSRLADFAATGVPYRSAPQALADIVGGRVDGIMIDVIASLGQIREGALTPIAVTARERSALLPDVPALYEAGGALSGFDFGAWNGIFAPAGTPAEVTATLSEALIRIVTRDDMRGRLAAVGFDVTVQQPAAFQAFVSDELQRWADAVRAAGIQPE